MKRGKKYRASAQKIDSEKVYSVDEGVKLVLDSAYAKFDESIDIVAQLGVDTKQSDQQVRGALTLPNGLGKDVKVIVFAKSEHKEAQEAGADFVGAEDLVEKIKEGWLDFDRVIATPETMPLVAKVAKILGPKGKMPSPKLGTVTPKVAAAVKAEKKGKASFRTDKQGSIHTSIGKKSMGFEKIKQNYLALAGEIMRLKPQSSKGVYLKKISISSSMGLGVALNTSDISRGKA